MTLGRFCSLEVPSIDETTISNLILHGVSSQKVTSILEAKGYEFSPVSIRNITDALKIFRKVPSESIVTFFVYGSTAKGQCGLVRKTQEIQFWTDSTYLGSCFRYFGSSDLDMRCISDNPKAVADTFVATEPISPSPLTLRIDTTEFVIQDITDKQNSSFYRRILLFNKPLIFFGESQLDSFASMAEDYITPRDHEYVTQMIQFRTFIQAQLEKCDLTYITANQLSGMFPVFCNDTELRNVNTKRLSQAKIVFGRGEGSLLTWKVGDTSEVKRLMETIANFPQKTVREILEFENRDRVASQ